MTDTPIKRKRGRPLLYGERLERIQVLVTQDQRRAAEKEADRRGVSASEVIRAWLDKGRQATARRATR